MELLKVVDLSAGDQKTVKGLAGTVAAISKQFEDVREKAREAAPRIMRFFKELQVKHDSLDFVGFVRLFDPTLPPHADEKNGVKGYRTNRTYYALDYMRRLLTVRTGGARGQVDPATDELARLIATMLTVVKDPEPIWKAVATELQFGDRAIARLKTRVGATKPLLNLGIKPLNIPAAQVIHMEPRAKAAGVPAVAGVDLAQRGKRAKIAA